MHSSDFVYLDVRWREDGWREAMRGRLTGWLPEHLAAQGVDKGVLQIAEKRGGKHVTLTSRGMALTEPGPHSFSSENCWQLAQFLRTEDDSDDWLQTPGEEIVQCVDAPLSATYRDRLLTFLHPGNTSGDALR